MSYRKRTRRGLFRKVSPRKWYGAKFKGAPKRQIMYGLTGRRPFQSMGLLTNLDRAAYNRWYRLTSISWPQFFRWLFKPMIQDAKRKVRQREREKRKEANRREHAKQQALREREKLAIKQAKQSAANRKTITRVKVAEQYVKQTTEKHWFKHMFSMKGETDIDANK